MPRLFAIFTTLKMDLQMVDAQQLVGRFSSLRTLFHFLKSPIVTLLLPKDLSEVHRELSVFFPTVRDSYPRYSLKLQMPGRW